jgi:quercetin dioxygenase-like cupin family protein
LSDATILAADLNAALDDLRREGFRLDAIYPADDPHTAILSRAAERVRLTTQPGAPEPPAEPPAFASEFVLTHAGADGGEGRAGMLYRDLIPSRLGGRYIASHITIREGGPVSDWVHFHRIAFQMIAVRRGWVRVVYEDQGGPFIMEAGDLVLQPPEIRHRVLESSPGLEVVEITCPALHETFADHDISLPNGRVDRDRRFGGQSFLRHVAKGTPWTPFNGGEAQETAMRAATGGLAEVRVIRPSASSKIAFAPHDGELVFGFVLEGSAGLDYAGSHALGPADSFAIPPGEAWALNDASADLRLLQVTTQGLAAPSRSPL